MDGTLAPRLFSLNPVHVAPLASRYRLVRPARWVLSLVGEGSQVLSSFPIPSPILSLWLAGCPRSIGQVFIISDALDLRIAVILITKWLFLSLQSEEILPCLVCFV